MSQAMIVQTQFLSKRYEIKNCVGTSALVTRLNWNERNCTTKLYLNGMLVTFGSSFPGPPCIIKPSIVVPENDDYTKHLFTTRSQIAGEIYRLVFNTGEKLQLESLHV